MTEAARPQACVIEIIERTTDPLGSGDPIVPNEIRINGHPVLAPKYKPVRVHDIEIDGSDVVQVTLTLFARIVHIGEESK